MTVNRTHQINARFFESIDCEAKAYWLGFLTADGYVNERTGRLVLALATVDAAHVGKLKLSLGYSGPVALMPPGPFGGKGTARLEVTCRQLVLDLCRLGLYSGKSKTVSPWQGDPDLLRHYWRGVVDGDGSLSRWKNNWMVELCGSNSMVSGFADFVGRATGDYTKPLPSKSIWVVKFCGTFRSQEIARLLYSEAQVYLDRKKDKADQFINAQHKTRAQKAASWKCGMAVTIDGETKTVAGWARYYGIARSTVHNRIHLLGWSVEEAITTPVSQSYR